MRSLYTSGDRGPERGKHLPRALRVALVLGPAMKMPRPVYPFARGLHNSLSTIILQFVIPSVKGLQLAQQ